MYTLSSLFGKVYRQVLVKFLVNLTSPFYNNISVNKRCAQHFRFLKTPRTGAFSYVEVQELVEADIAEFYPFNRQHDLDFD